MDKIGGAITLLELSDFKATPAHYPYYRDRLRDKHLLRQTVKTLMESLQKCYDQYEDVPQAVAAICAGVVDSIKPEVTGGQKSFRTHLSEYMDVLAGSPDCRNHRNRHQNPLGCLHNATFGGLTPTMAWLMCAYPSQGKSTLAQNAMEDVARSGRHVAWYSYEMDRDECMDRVIIAHSGIAPEKVFDPKEHMLSKEDYVGTSRKGYGGNE